MSEGGSVEGDEETGSRASDSAGHAATPLPEIGEKSVVLSLDPEGKLGPGIRLKDLADEVKVPDLAMGAEKYRILDLLGEGGMGKVYLAYDRDRTALVQIGVYESKARLSELIQRASTGVEVILTGNGSPVARIVPMGSGATSGRTKLVDEILAYSKRIKGPRLDLRRMIDEGRD
jgi:prevent-host-death family protein